MERISYLKKALFLSCVVGAVAAGGGTTDRDDVAVTADRVWQDSVRVFLFGCERRGGPKWRVVPMLSTFARKLVAVRENEPRGKERGDERRLMRRREGSEESWRLWEDVNRWQVDLDGIGIEATEEKGREEVVAVEGKKWEQELEEVRGKVGELERDLKRTKRVLGRVTVQKRGLEREVEVVKGERDAALTEGRNLAKSWERAKKERLSVRSYLIQLCRFYRDGRRTDKLTKAREELKRAVGDESLEVVLTALEEMEVAHSINREEDLPMEKTCLRSSSLLRSRKLVDSHFRWVRSSFRADNAVGSFGHLEADRIQLHSALDDIEQTIEELGRENLRLESELRRGQLGML